MSAALGPVVVTGKELELLEAAHRRLLEDEADGGSGGRVADAAVEEGSDGAAEEARLSLVARGLLDHRGELPEENDPAVLVLTMLDLRLAAERVLVVDRVVAGAGPQTVSGPDERDGVGPDEGGAAAGVVRGTRLLHLIEDGACVEDVLPDGSRHLYLLLDLEEVVPWVTDVTVPPDAVAASGPSVAVRPGRPEEIALLLGRPTALVELSVLPSLHAALATLDDRDASRVHHLLALGPSGCWLTQVDPGRSLPERVVFRPVGPGWVGRWVRSAAGPVRAGDRPGEHGGQGTMAG